MKRYDNGSPRSNHCDNHHAKHRDTENGTVVPKRGRSQETHLGKGVRLKHRRNGTVVPGNPSFGTVVGRVDGTVVVTVLEKEAAGLRMSQTIKLLWLPIERAAELTHVSMRTMWRQIKAGKWVVVKRSINVENWKTRKTYVLADQVLYRLEQEDCEIKGIEARVNDQASLTIKGKEYPSLFVMGYSLRTEDQQGVDHE